MSDRISSDNVSRSAVKNPLLSTAVVGLCIDDLTHGGVLLPVAQNPGLILSQETPAPPTQPTNPQPPKPLPPQPRPSNTTTTTKPEHDDFDVNEYIARLQGTRYVSAPINAPVDDNANFESTEQNLEEINLNEERQEDVQSSLTSDIAQNFSQLPTVLPQVASAVFTSFSNMLKVRTPEPNAEMDREVSYRPVGFDVGVRDDVMKVATPPPPPTQLVKEAAKEPPVGCTPQSYRITTKKKAYAQIPGLSANNPVTIPNPMSYNMPPPNPTLQMPSHLDANSNVPPPNFFNPLDQAHSVTSPAYPLQAQSDVVDRTDVVQPTIDTYSVSTHDVTKALSQTDSCNVTQIASDVNQHQFPNQSVIPPPTMFCNEPKKDTCEVTRTILPPSVARRLSSSQPLVKSPPSIPNIFVPNVVENSNQGSIVTPPDMTNFTVPNVPLTSEAYAYNPHAISTTETVQKFESVTQNITEPPKIFDNPPPTSFFQPHAAITTPETQPAPMFDPASIIQPRVEPPKPVPEPPKASGPANYRLTKKRPQYYAGPIEGVGAISNNVKPVIPTVDSNSNFQGALFTPQSLPQEQAAITESNIIPTLDMFPSVPQPSAPTSSVQQAFDISTNITPYANQSYQDTAFDLSRQTTDIYEPPKQENKGFGLIGSLKSKLGSIDINKIQNTVTTFFDPAYNDTAKVSNQNADEYRNETYQAAMQGQQTFDISVPDMTYHNQPYYGHTSAGDVSNQYYNYPQTNEQYNQSTYPQTYYQQPQGNSQVNFFKTDPNTVQDAYANQSYFSEVKSADSGESTAYGVSQSQVPFVTETYQTYPQTSGNIASQLPQQVTTNNVLKENIAQSSVYVDNSLSAPANFFDQSVSLDADKKEIFIPSQAQDGQMTNSVPEVHSPKQPDCTLPHTFNNQPSAFVGTQIPQQMASNIFEVPNQSVEQQIVQPPTSFFDVNNFSQHSHSFAPLQSSVVEGTKPPSAIESVENVKQIDSKEPYKSVLATSEFQLSNLSAQAAQSFFESVSGQHDMLKDSLFSPVVEPSPHNEDSAAEIEKSKLIVDEVKEIANQIGFISLNNPSTSAPEASDENNSKFLSKELGSEKLFEEKLQAIENVFANTGPSDFFKPQVDISETQKPEPKKFDVTSKLIQNITSPIQLLNPVEVPFESNTPAEDRIQFDTNQCAEISHITEETIETIQVQSATDLLDEKEMEKLDRNLEDNQTVDYGWYPESTAIASNVATEHNYTQSDSNVIGFFNKNIFGDDFPNNASDEIKAELKTAHDEPQQNLLSRQMSVPTAPPEEDIDEIKDDVTGVLDVQLIEQDAKNDIFEEYIIEPSETDDDKIEYKERERASEDPPTDIDSFTKRVDKFQKQEQPSEEVASTNDSANFNTTVFDSNVVTSTSPAITIASYFDTGNYAADSHYRKSLTSPNSTSFSVGSPNQSVPILATLTSTTQAPIVPDVTPQVLPFSPVTPEVNETGLGSVPEPYVPETSTQTRPLATFTDSFAADFFKADRVTVTSSYTPHMTFPDVVKDTRMCGDGGFFKPGYNMENVQKDVTESKETLPNIPVANVVQQPTLQTTNLPNPLEFFASTNTSESKTETDAESNRLASYFSSPKKTDQTKSFFELSQSQDHFRDRANNNPTNIQNTFNIPQDQFNANLNLMRDLTSVDNYTPSGDQVVRTVNYFTVEYDTLHKGDVITGEETLRGTKTEPEEDLKNITHNADIETEIVNCKLCIDALLSQQRRLDLNKECFKTKQAMDSGNGSEKGKAGDAASQTKQGTSDRALTVTFNVPDDHCDESEGILNEQRRPSEYTPVKHHWFYRVDKDDKSVWRGFSVADSDALEQAYLSPDLDDNTTVPTDGGRYDVNIKGRLRVAVYWKEKPTNIRRCSWYYKGNTDPRYVPYSEDVAAVLEEEYAQGVKTGAWHRRVALGGSECVVMHTRDVLVHLLSTPADAWTGNRQAATRPRVVHRGHDESSIEDPCPSAVDHLLLMCHGVGQYCDMRLRCLELVVDEFRASSLQLIKNHYKNAYDRGDIGRIEVLPVSWHESLHAGESGVDRRLAAVTLDSIPLLRGFTNDTVLDVLLYTSPLYCQKIIDTVCKQLNHIYSLFIARNPNFNGEVSVGGHSLGSVILYDILCHQTSKECPSPPTPKTYLPGAEGQPNVKFPKLDFEPSALYAFGSPIAIFECIRGVDSLGPEFRLPTCPHVFNIFHPHDPVAFRLEPLVNPELKEVPPALIPHHKGRKRMHLELKETLARVGADLKTRLVESLKASWLSVWRSEPPPTLDLEKVVEEEIEKEELEQEKNAEAQEDLDQKLTGRLGQLNAGRRIDYVLQEAPIDSINPYLSAITKHCCYWESQDTMLLVLREVYAARGLRPDAAQPLRSLAVDRETEPDEWVSAESEDLPSTSHS